MFSFNQIRSGVRSDKKQSLFNKRLLKNQQATLLERLLIKKHKLSVAQQHLHYPRSKAGVTKKKHYCRESLKAAASCFNGRLPKLAVAHELRHIVQQADYG